MTIDDIVLIKEKVAAGLRAMGKKPAGFVFIDFEGDEGWTWDEPTIFDYVVMKMMHHRNSNRNICRFVPLGSTESSITSEDRKTFAEAYNDYQLEPTPCLHPYASRTYYGNNCSKCNICGAEFS